PSRYPYVYEFEKALALDPSNEALRRELAYLHVQMGNRQEAEKQFQLLPALKPALIERTAEPSVALSPGHKAMAIKSLDFGYMNDALLYLHAAHENDPADFDVDLKLGWAYNQLKNDREAVRWFDLARRSPDLGVSQEAGKAYRNLEPSTRR